MIIFILIIVLLIITPLTLIGCSMLIDYAEFIMMSTVVVVFLLLGIWWYCSEYYDMVKYFEKNEKSFKIPLDVFIEQFEIYPQKYTLDNKSVYVNLESTRHLMYFSFWDTIKYKRFKRKHESQIKLNKQNYIIDKYIDFLTKEKDENEEGK